MAASLLEVCVSGVEDALVAEHAGADRLELNATLEHGGLTPSLGLLREVVVEVKIPVVAMVRPRFGDFCYYPAERRVILQDVELLLAAGAAGVASGGLLANGSLDLLLCGEVVRVAHGKEVVFHRAFDVVAAPQVALEQLIELGTTRILTSGGLPTALAGTDRLAQLQATAAGRIQVLPGGGINSANVREILARTGCRQVHGSFREPAVSQQTALDGMGTVVRTSGAMVAAVRQELNGIQESSGNGAP